MNNGAYKKAASNKLYQHVSHEDAHRLRLVHGEEAHGPVVAARGEVRADRREAYLPRRARAVSVRCVCGACVMCLKTCHAGLACAW